MSTEKQFGIPGEQILPVAPGRGSCLASDMILCDGEPVGYMYREPPDSKHDSGWRFFAGLEDEEYAQNADNFGVYDVNTVANYDRTIVPLLDAPVGSAFEQDEDGTLVPAPFPGAEDA